MGLFRPVSHVSKLSGIISCRQGPPILFASCQIFCDFDQKWALPRCDAERLVSDTDTKSFLPSIGTITWTIYIRRNVSVMLPRRFFVIGSFNDYAGGVPVPSRWERRSAKVVNWCTQFAWMSYGRIWQHSQVTQPISHLFGFIHGNYWGMIHERVCEYFQST